VKNAVAIALLFWAWGGSAHAASNTRVEKVSFLGKEYVRLDQWARANGFQHKWPSRNEVVVWNGSKRMQFTTDSKRMELNDIAIVLSEAIRQQNGVAYLASLDLTTTLNPLLFPPKSRARASVKHICLDPGHGGRDIGESNGREYEKKYALLLAQELAAQLRKSGYTVSFTRTTDAFVELPVRPELARRRGADLLISLHFNSSGGGTGPQGAETYCMTPARASSTNARGEGASNRNYDGNVHNARNMVLAYEIQKAMVRDLKSEDRGVKRARFAVLRDAEMPAVLIEGGFMSNPSEARNIYSAAWRARLAQAIASGIASYRRVIEP
jgi:N-acetylmuramoyl-L-alanine amidase